MYNKSSDIKMEVVYSLYRCTYYANFCNLISQLTNGLEHTA